MRFGGDTWNFAGVWWMNLFVLAGSSYGRPDLATKGDVDVRGGDDAVAGGFVSGVFTTSKKMKEVSRSVSSLDLD